LGASSIEANPKGLLVFIAGGPFFGAGEGTGFYSAIFFSKGLSSFPFATGAAGFFSSSFFVPKGSLLTFFDITGGSTGFFSSYFTAGFGAIGAAFGSSFLGNGSASSFFVGITGIICTGLFSSLFFVPKGSLLTFFVITGGWTGFFSSSFFVPKGSELTFFGTTGVGALFVLGVVFSSCFFSNGLSFTVDFGATGGAGFFS